MEIIYQIGNEHGIDYLHRREEMIIYLLQGTTKNENQNITRINKSKT